MAALNARETTTLDRSPATTWLASLLRPEMFTALFLLAIAIRLALFPFFSHPATWEHLQGEDQRFLLGLDPLAFDLGMGSSFRVFHASAYSIFLIFNAFGIHPTVLLLWLMKMPGLIGDILVGVTVYRLVKVLKQDAKIARLAALTYMFNPLSIWETAAVGHPDQLMIAFLLLSFYWTTTERYFRAGYSFAIAIFFRYFLVLLLPVFVWFFLKTRPKRATAAFFSAATIGISVASLPYFAILSSLGWTSSLASYYLSIFFGGYSGATLDVYIRGTSPEYFGFGVTNLMYRLGLFPDAAPVFSAFVLVAVFMIGTLVIIRKGAPGIPHLTRCALFLVSAFLFLRPLVFDNYFLWFLPLAVLESSLGKREFRVPLWTITSLVLITLIVQGYDVVGRFILAGIAWTLINWTLIAVLGALIALYLIWTMILALWKSQEVRLASKESLRLHIGTAWYAWLAAAGYLIVAGWGILFYEAAFPTWLWITLIACAAFLPGFLVAHISTFWHAYHELRHAITANCILVIALAVGGVILYPLALVLLVPFAICNIVVLLAPSLSKSAVSHFTRDAMFIGLSGIAIDRMGSVGALLLLFAAVFWLFSMFLTLLPRKTESTLRKFLPARRGRSSATHSWSVARVNAISVLLVAATYILIATLATSSGNPFFQNQRWYWNTDLSFPLERMEHGEVRNGRNDTYTFLYWLYPMTTQAIASLASPYIEIAGPPPQSNVPPHLHSNLTVWPGNTSVTSWTEFSCSPSTQLSSWGAESGDLVLVGNATPNSYFSCGVEAKLNDLNTSTFHNLLVTARVMTPGANWLVQVLYADGSTSSYGGGLGGPSGMNEQWQVFDVNLTPEKFASSLRLRVENNRAGAWSYGGPTAIAVRHLEIGGSLVSSNVTVFFNNAPIFAANLAYLQNGSYTVNPSLVPGWFNTIGRARFTFNASLLGSDAVVGIMRYNVSEWAIDSLSFGVFMPFDRLETPYYAGHWASVALLQFATVATACLFLRRLPRWISG